MARRLVIPALALLFVGASAPGLRAEDKPADAAAKGVKAIKAGDKARAALPLPGEGNGLEYEGEVWMDGVWGGTVRLKAEAGTLNDAPCWLVREDVFWDFAGTEWRVGLSATLRRDLTMEAAEVELKTKARVTRYSLARGADGWRGQKQVVEGEVEGPFEEITIKAPPGSSVGLTSLALFARGPLPTTEPAFALSWLDAVAFARGQAAVPLTLTVAPKGAGTFDAAPGKPASWSAALEGLAQTAALHVVPTKERSLLGLVGLVDAKALVLKAGLRPEGTFDEKGPARTWQAAFLKFGVGYHMAREELLEAAFHWPTMYEYESSLVDGWPKSKPIEEFKAAWIGEFVAQSKRRTRAETDDLLKMTLATGRPEEKGPERLIFHAHANFGGGQARSYHFRRIEGIWFLVRMEDTQ